MMKTLPFHIFLFVISSLVHSQNAAPEEATEINDTKLKAKTGMMADSPVTFPDKGALPRKFVPDVKTTSLKLSEGYSFTSTPCRSLTQIEAIRKEMPTGSFDPVPTDWAALPRTRKLLTAGGDLHIVGVGDSIINDIMRSGWVGKLQEACPKVNIKGNVYVRGGGACYHYKEENRVQKVIVPAKPDLVFIGGISQKGDIDSIREVIRMIRADLPDTEILLATGCFGGIDPRDAKAMSRAQHSGTGDYGIQLKKLATEEKCAFLDMTTPWIQYINSSGKHPHVFYRDRVHANEYGEQIAAKILLSFFRME